MSEQIYKTLLNIDWLYYDTMTAIFVFAVVFMWNETSFRDHYIFNFTKWRTWFEYYNDEFEGKFWNWLKDLLSCPYCVGVWVTLIQWLFTRCDNSDLYSPHIFVIYAIFVILWKKIIEI